MATWRVSDAELQRVLEETEATIQHEMGGRVGGVAIQSDQPAPRSDYEHLQQTALFQEAAYRETEYPDLQSFYAIPNGGDRHPVVGARMKAEGVKSGVPDTHLPVARLGFHSLYIEMKTPGQRLSENQVLWGKRLRAAGNLVIVCYSSQEAMQTLIAYLEEDEDVIADRKRGQDERERI